MESSTSQLNIIKEHFPLHHKKIESLYDTDPAFRSLCSDYILCLQFFSRIRSEVTEKKQSVEEYEQVKKDLESELKHYLL